MDINTLANIAWEAHTINMLEYTAKDELMFKSGFIIAFKIQELEKRKMAKGLQQVVENAKKVKEDKEAVIGDNIEEPK